MLRNFAKEEQATDVAFEGLSIYERQFGYGILIYENRLIPILGRELVVEEP